MSSPDQLLAVKTLQDIIALGRATDLPDMVLPLEQHVIDLQKKKPTFKLLRETVKPLTDRAYIAIEKKVYDFASFAAWPGMEKHLAEFKRVFLQWSNIVYPPEPQPAELDASKFVGAEAVENKTVPYWGNPANVRNIVEKTLELLRRYTSAIAKGDFDAAYAMTAGGLQAWMTKKRFVTEHEQAAKRYGGPAVEYRVDNFQFVYADDSARQKSKSDEGWPKSTPKEERRSCVIGFWIRDRKAETGCWGGFLFSEENGEYRIAKFTFYTQ